ncbi:MAG: shikimate kinase [Clostridiales bacterium]|nr:shikimate kinase [Clostridiales bacterium]
MRCGLLGKTLGHSYSPQIHAQLGDYSYELFEKQPEELENFLRHGEFDALNVTIPYKKAVLPYCAVLSDAVKAIGSANTLVRQPDGTLFADNTDAFGFSCIADECGVNVAGKKALVFGSGGASVTAQYVLKTRGAREVLVISRSGEHNYENLDKNADAEILVNTTPLGMYPNNGASPADLTRFPRCAAVLDVVYNPARTALLLQAEALGIPHAGGLLMLVAQAKRASELFTGSAIADTRIGEIYRTLAVQMQNIVLVGMPGCGKSSIGTLLAEKLDRPFLDADAEIEKAAGMPIPDFFKLYGEAAFRDLESRVLAELGKRSGAVIATGGGAVLREENYAALHQNSTIVWLTRDLARLPIDGRPVSQATSLDALFAARKARYERFADHIIDNNGAPDETVRAILEALR